MTRKLTVQERKAFRAQAAVAYRLEIERISNLDVEAHGKSLGMNATRKDYEFVLDEIDRASGYRSKPTQQV